MGCLSGRRRRRKGKGRGCRKGEVGGEEARRHRFVEAEAKGRRRWKGKSGRLVGRLVGLVAQERDIFVMIDALSCFHTAKLNHIHFSFQHQTRSISSPLLSL